MQRRSFITLLGGAAAAWPCRKGAAGGDAGGGISQWRISGDDPRTSCGVSPGPSRCCYVEGRNVAIEYRWADNHYDRLPALAAELVRRQVAVIFVGGSTPGAHTLKAATQTIPIVFLVGPDPVAGGLVASLNRPGGNLTGVRVLTSEVIAKNLQMLHELIPTATVIAVLHPDNFREMEAVTEQLQRAAGVFGVRLLVLKAADPSEVDAAFATMAQERANGLVVSGETFFITASDQIIALAARHAMPTIFQYRESTLAGGLMSYGIDNREAYCIVGVYTGRFLKGDKPADLPVQQSTKVELIINMRTAKALGLTFPTALLVRADEVIE